LLSKHQNYRPYRLIFGCPYRGGLDQSIVIADREDIQAESESELISY